MITKIHIENYKIFDNFTLDLNKNLNIIVGDNETGKSTILEAINLTLTKRLNGKYIDNELTPYLFNQKSERNYLQSLQEKKSNKPPKILIELYLQDQSEFAKLKGSNNTCNEDIPGIKLEILFNDDFNEEYESLIKDEANKINNIPSEYYKVQWNSFALTTLTLRNIPIKVGFTDTTSIRLQSGTDYYLQEIIKNRLDIKEKVDLNISYRKLKEEFSNQQPIKDLNDKLKITNSSTITAKDFSILLDISGRSNWETLLIPHLDNLPVFLSGKGEQNVLKILLSLETKKTKEADVILVEEPENHLSFTSMNKLIKEIEGKCSNKQIILTTHSTFVLNKLGLKQLILLNDNKSTTLSDLEEDTQNYFQKLSGYDTLRLVLGKKTILVEGASDELIVQKAYQDKYNKMPIKDGVDVLNVRGLSFLRFLEIAEKLNKEIIVITDNDGDYETKIKNKYSKYMNNKKIKIAFSDNNANQTLEPQIVADNEIGVLNEIFKTEYTTKDELKEFMKNNKTDCALKIFNTSEKIKMPKYITDAI